MSSTGVSLGSVFIVCKYSLQTLLAENWLQEHQYILGQTFLRIHFFSLSQRSKAKEVKEVKVKLSTALRTLQFRRKLKK